jgi:hypothetical protein
MQDLIRLSHTAGDESQCRIAIVPDQQDRAVVMHYHPSSGVDYILERFDVAGRFASRTDLTGGRRTRSPPSGSSLSESVSFLVDLLEVQGRN